MSPTPEAPHGWLAVVVTPPPSETFIIARAPAYATVLRKANEWAGGGISWTTPFEGVAPYGERVHIEPAGRKAPPKERPLSRIRWDEIFETGVFEQWLGPELGFELNKFGEVPTEKRAAFEKSQDPLMDWLVDRVRYYLGLDAYSASGGPIYPSDVKELINLIDVRTESGPKGWKPGERDLKPLARALKKMLKDLTDNG